MSGHYSRAVQAALVEGAPYTDHTAEHARIADGPAPAAEVGTHTLTNHGSAVIAGVKVYAIYPGPMSFDVAAMDDFGRDMVLGGYLDGTKEQGAGRGTLYRSYQYAAAPSGWAAGMTVTEDMIAAVIGDAIARGGVPAPEPSALYMVFSPEGVIVTFDGDPAHGASCTSFCGFHSTGTTPAGAAITYGVVGDCTCSGCLDVSAVDGAQMVFAHETAEAVTDSSPGSGWYDAVSGMENADLCAWQQVPYGPWVLQPYWTNAAGATVGPYEDHHTHTQPQPQRQPIPGVFVTDPAYPERDLFKWCLEHEPSLYATMKARAGAEGGGFDAWEGFLVTRGYVIN